MITATVVTPPRKGRMIRIELDYHDRSGSYLIKPIILSELEYKALRKELRK